MTHEQLEQTFLAPQSLEAEMALLGAILVNNEAMHRVVDAVQPEHFSEPVHARIFETCRTLILASKLASPVTIARYFETDQTMQEIGGTAYLGRLAGNAVTVLTAIDYARNIRETAQRRQLIEIGDTIANKAMLDRVDNPVEKIVREAEEQLYKVAVNRRQGKGIVPFSTALTETIEAAAKAYQNRGLVGMQTGLVDLDNKLGGMQNSDLIIIAARPSMGKTALVTSIGYNVAKAGHTVAFFSLEMSGEQLANRILAQHTGLSSERVRRGQISETEFNTLVEASQEMVNLPFMIDGEGSLTVAQVMSRARRLQRERGLDLVIVDYLQLMQSETRGSNRVQEVTEITVALKSMAKELNVPVLALSQLSRQVESRDDKKPLLSDLRESGSIEQDSDIVMFIYREEYYLARSEPQAGTPEHFKWQDAMSAALGKAEIIIAKQRHGPIGKVEVAFIAGTTKFGNLDTVQREFNI